MIPGPNNASQKIRGVLNQNTTVAVKIVSADKVTAREVIKNSRSDRSRINTIIANNPAAAIIEMKADLSVATDICAVEPVDSAV